MLRILLALTLALLTWLISNIACSHTCARVRACVPVPASESFAPGCGSRVDPTTPDKL